MSVPAGALTWAPQFGNEFRCPANVNRTWFVPSALAVKTLKFWPPRSRTNAMCEPSGDQAGSASKIGAFVRLCWFVPSAFTTKTDLLPQKLVQVSPA